MPIKRQSRTCIDALDLSSIISRQESSKINDLLLSSLADSQLAVALFDPEDRMRMANSAFRNAYAIEVDLYPYWADMIRNCFATGEGAVIVTDDIESWIADVSTRRRKAPHRAFQCDMADGRWMWMNESMSPDGWLFCIASDITSLKTNEQTLQRARDSAMLAAQTDALTGVYNRRFIFARLSEELVRMKSGSAGLCVAVLDLDHFKQINDTYGHLAGDRILQSFAASVQTNLRPTDLVGRIGGEEFLLLMPATSLADCAQAVERIQWAVSMKVALPEHSDICYTFSAGLTDMRATDTVSGVFDRADRALYAAKERGRNRYVAAFD